MPASSEGMYLSGCGRVILVILLIVGAVYIYRALKNPDPVPIPTPQPTGISISTSVPAPTVRTRIAVNITNPNLNLGTAVVHVLDSKAGTFVDNTASFDGQTWSLDACVTGQHISVWVPGYYIKTKGCNETTSSYDVTLDSVDENDNPYYPTNPASNCKNCHANADPNSRLNEFNEWMDYGHSQALVHSYFRTTYLGTDVYGNQSQQIKWDILADGQKIYPILDPIQPNYGPAYQLDYPVSNGNCVFCHAPAALPGTRQEMDLSLLVRESLGSHIDAATEGVTCDVCHKVTDILVGKDQLPYDDRPGVLSMSILRPGLVQEFNAGPLAYQAILGMEPNTIPKRTCYPVFSESKFCAACHYGKFANTLIYGSYQEWLNSSYSRPENFRSCQDCHMRDPNQSGNVFLGKRDACSGTNQHFNFSHNMMNYGHDPENSIREIPLLVKEAAHLTLESFSDAGQMRIRVTVQNTGAGHKFPTDSPLRHLILLVEATDWRGNKLTQSGGPMIPIWAAPDLGGLPGEIYANILKDKDTNLAPTFSYWNPVETAWQGADTRLVPGMPVQNVYSFAAPYEKWAKVTAKLIYRKAFMNVVRQKGWQLGDLDIVAAEACMGIGPVPEGWDCRTAQP